VAQLLPYACIAVVALRQTELNKDKMRDAAQDGNDLLGSLVQRACCGEFQVMSITTITIENFKGIADPVSIPIRPITLLFGKNSAGKSTILQALHYLREVLEHRQPDPDRTHIGGDAIDLGGFQSLVHRNQLDRRIRIRVAFSLGDDGIPNNDTAWPGGDLIEEIRELRFDLNNQVKLESAWIETITAWQEGRGAYIAEYATGLNGDELVRLSGFYGVALNLVKVNADQAIVRALDDGYCMEPENFFLMLSRAKGLPVHERNSIIPEPDKPFFVHNAFYTDKSTSSKDTFTSSENELFWSMVGQALTGPLAVLLRELRGIRYLGPIREIPPRTYRAPKTPMESCWASGLGAWDVLIRDSDLVEQTSHYLQDVLKIGYSIHHRELLSIDAKGEIMAALRRLAAQYKEKDASDKGRHRDYPLAHYRRRGVHQTLA
jgi:hypothetical protein